MNEIQQYKRRKMSRLLDRFYKAESMDDKVELAHIIGRLILEERERDDGGPGSGNHGHEGVPGHVGGSAPAGSNVGGEEHKPISQRSSPAVKSAKNFEEYVKDKGLKKIYRGFSAKTEEILNERDSDIKNGTATTSGDKSSALGVGLYFSDDEGEAEGYMNRRRQEKGYKYGEVITAALDEGAVVGTYNDYNQKKFDEYNAIMEKVWTLPTMEEMRAMADEAMKIQKMSVSEYAATKGCDAIYDAGTGYTVVVNQNALVVKDDGAD